MAGHHDPHRGDGAPRPRGACAARRRPAALRVRGRHDDAGRVLDAEGQARKGDRIAARGGRCGKDTDRDNICHGPLARNRRGHGNIDVAELDGVRLRRGRSHAQKVRAERAASEGRPDGGRGRRSRRGDGTFDVGVYASSFTLTISVAEARSPALAFTFTFGFSFSSLSSGSESLFADVKVADIPILGSFAACDSGDTGCQIDVLCKNSPCFFGVLSSNTPLFLF